MTNFSALLFYSVSVCKYEKKIGELKNDKEDFVKGTACTSACVHTDFIFIGDRKRRHCEKCIV